MFKREIWLLLAVALIALPLSTAAQADVTIEIGNVKAAPGAMVSVAVTATSDAPGGEEMEGYSLPLDFGDDGVGLPAGLTFNGLTQGTAFGGATVNSDFNDFFDIDGNVSDTTPTAGVGVVLDSTPTLLFNLDFTLDSGVAQGTVFNLVVNEGVALFQVAGDAGGVLNAGSAGGSITAVPEPGSLAFLAAGSLGMIALRRRRR